MSPPLPEDPLLPIPYKTNTIFPISPSLIFTASNPYIFNIVLFGFSLSNNMNSNNGSGSKFSQYIKAPIRVLCKARDLYVNSMNGYAGRMRCGGTTLPRSFSVNSSRVNEDEDLRALMRAVSQRRQQEEAVTGALEAVRSKGLPTSFSVGIWRIDEDKPCYFQEDLKNSDVLMYPRSRSYAVNKRTGMVG